MSQHKKLTNGTAIKVIAASVTILSFYQMAQSNKGARWMKSALTASDTMLLQSVFAMSVALTVPAILPTHAQKRSENPSPGSSGASHCLPFAVDTVLLRFEVIVTSTTTSNVHVSMPGQNMTE